MEQDLPVVVAYRMPVTGRSARGTPARAESELVTAAATLRAVPPGAMEPVEVPGLGYSQRYYAHAGRAWTALHPRDRSIIRWSRAADLDEARAILARGGSEFASHGFRPSPFAAFTGGMRPLAVAEGFPGGAEALRAAVAGRVAEAFARDIVHDGRHAYLAARPPAVTLSRGRSGGWTYRTGPATPFDPVNDEIPFCVRQAPRFAGGLRALDPELARQVLREARGLAAPFAHLPPDDADLTELANAATVGALWLKGRLRRAPAPDTAAGEDFAGRVAAVRRRAALGMYGAIPEAERVPAIEDAVRLVRDLAEANRRAAVAPEMRAFLAYADLVALPRIAEAAAVPGEDLEPLASLAR